MKRIIIACLLFIVVKTGSAEEITNGTYTLFFNISDVGFVQTVTITNCTKSIRVPEYKFDIILEREGSFKRSDGDWQSVKGIVYNGRFTFVLPSASVVSVAAFCFEGLNQSSNGVFIGQGDVPFHGRNEVYNKFSFRMHKWTSAIHTEFDFFR